MRRNVFLAVALATTASLGIPAAAHASAAAPHPALRTIATYDFSKGETAENIAVGPDGTLYVTLAVAATLEVRRPGAAVKRIRLDAGEGGVVAGVALDHAGNVWVAVSAPDPDRIGVYRLRRHPGGGLGAPDRIAPLPVGAVPNGLAFDSGGNLYVAGSAAGVVYRLPRGAHRAQVWAAGPELSQDTSQAQDGITFPGPNGIKVFRGAVYVSNSSRYDVLRIPVRADGTAGPITVRYPGVVADDFAFDVRGNLYVTTDPFQTVERVAPNGARTVLATRADGLDGPSAAAFGTGRHRADLYITDLGFFGTTHQPALQVLPVGIPGARLP